MSMNRFRGTVEWALMVGLVLGAGAMAQARDANAEDGQVIQIGRPDAEPSIPPLPPPLAGAQEVPLTVPEESTVPKHWIGLAGGSIDPDHPLRAHVDIPAGQGLLVANVVPDSPAAKAGLKTHDILLRANDTDLREMQDLVELVLTEGEKDSQITLEVLRRGQRETVYVTPEERPADAVAPPPRGIGGFGDGLGALGEGLPRDLLGQLPLEFRQFGPGVIFGEPGPGLGAIPNGFSVSVFKDADQPPRITVKRGNETWEVVGDDPKALAELPEEVRPYVERVLQGGSAIGFRPGQPALPEFGDGRLRERLEQMERRIQELQERLFRPNDQPAEEPK